MAWNTYVVECMEFCGAAGVAVLEDCSGSFGSPGDRVVANGGLFASEVEDS